MFAFFFFFGINSESWRIVSHVILCLPSVFYIRNLFLGATCSRADLGRWYSRTSSEIFCCMFLFFTVSRMHKRAERRASLFFSSFAQK